MKSTTEMKNSLEGIHSRSELAEERYNELEDRLTEIMQPEDQRGKKRMKKTEQSLREMWHTVIHSIINVERVPEGQERKKKKNVK